MSRLGGDEPQAGAVVMRGGDTLAAIVEADAGHRRGDGRASSAAVRFRRTDEPACLRHRPGSADRGSRPRAGTKLMTCSTHFEPRSASVTASPSGFTRRKSPSSPPVTMLPESASVAMPSTAPSCTVTLAQSSSGPVSPAKRTVPSPSAKAAKAPPRSNAACTTKASSARWTPRVSRTESVRRRLETRHPGGSADLAGFEAAPQHRPVQGHGPMKTSRLCRASPSFHGLMKSPSAIIWTAWKA